MFAWILFCAYWNDDHALRACQYFTYARINNYYHIHIPDKLNCTGDLKPRRPVVKQLWTEPFDHHVRSWLTQVCRHMRNDHPVLCPMIFVAAEGGGSRAAYWTGRLLDHLNSQTNGAFFHHVFAFSGVSGGSLGSAAFVAKELTVIKDGTQKGGFQRSVRSQQMRDFLADDYLSPILAGLLFPEMLQRFWPKGYEWFDRARPFELALEQSWEEHFETDHERNPFSNDMLALWPPALRDSTPALFLNATNVEDGVPFVVNSIDVPTYAHRYRYYAYDPNALYAIRFLPLSAAVHLSARFSYVNPPATLYSPPSLHAVKTRTPFSHGEIGDIPPVLPWGRLVDGGYYDNSGAETLSNVVLAVKDVVDRWRITRPKQAIEPVYIALVILNNPDVAGAANASLEQFEDSSARPATIPARPRELPGAELDAIFAHLGSHDGRAARTLDSSTTWRMRVAQSDLRSPVDAFFSTRGGDELGHRVALVDLTSQLAVGAIQSCYDRLYSRSLGDPIEYALAYDRPALGSFATCASPIAVTTLLNCQEAPSRRLPQGLGSLGWFFPLLRTQSAAASCEMPLVYEDLSFGRIEMALTAANPSLEQGFASPALGWLLSNSSRDTLDCDIYHIADAPAHSNQDEYQSSRTVNILNSYIMSNAAPCQISISKGNIALENAHPNVTVPTTLVNCTSSTPRVNMAEHTPPPSPPCPPSLSPEPSGQQIDEPKR